MIIVAGMSEEAGPPPHHEHEAVADNHHHDSKGNHLHAYPPEDASQQQYYPNAMVNLETQFRALGVQEGAVEEPYHDDPGESMNTPPDDNDGEDTTEDEPVKLFVGQVGYAELNYGRKICLSER